jgi:predicted deacetylase
MDMDHRVLCIVVHDVAPSTWSNCRRLLDGLAALDHFAVTLLAVPRYHGEQPSAAFESWLCERAALGDEIALHGYSHLDEGMPRTGRDLLRRRVYTRGEGEFVDLPFDEATLRLQAGREWLGRLGLEPEGFVAPAWLLGAQAWRALRCQPFAYTCTLRRIHLLPQRRSVVCQSQVYSSASAWRRGLSVLWNASLARAQAVAPLVRLELHPSDEEHAAIRNAWRRLAARQLDTRRVCTLKQVAAELRTASEQHQD